MNSEIKKNEIRIAIDIETLDTVASAIVVSIGLAAFNMQGGLVGTQYLVLDVNRQSELGRTTNADTMGWWNRQSKEVQAVLDEARGPLSMHPQAAIEAVAEFVSKFETQYTEVEGVYGYGSDFDNATIFSLARDVGTKPPWQFRKNRCGRTWLAAFPSAKAPQEGEKHNALDDAIWLAKSLRSALLQFNVMKETANVDSLRH